MYCFSVFSNKTPTENHRSHFRLTLEHTHTTFPRQNSSAWLSAHSILLAEIFLLKIFESHISPFRADKARTEILHNMSSGILMWDRSTKPWIICVLNQCHKVIHTTSKAQIYAEYLNLIIAKKHERTDTYLLSSGRKGKNSMFTFCYVVSCCSQKL